MKILELIGIDSWDRPVYRDQDGRLWKDILLGQFAPDLHSVSGNTFDGEPESRIEEDFHISE